jgi:hypothetical protein
MEVCQLDLGSDVCLRDAWVGKVKTMECEIALSEQVLHL